VREVTRKSNGISESIIREGAPICYKVPSICPLVLLILAVNKEFWEELIAYFPLIGHGPHIKRRVQQFYCCVRICCSGNVFTEPLPSNDNRDTYKHTQTDGRDL
jgi:hypothetical protein